MNIGMCRPKAAFLGLIVFVAFNSYGTLWRATVMALNLSDFPQIDLTQTANIRVVFLGVPPDYIEENSFRSSVSRSVSQFAHPNNVTWNLNVSIDFLEFPVDAMKALLDNAYHFEETTYYNITLLDALLFEFEYLTIPKRGYLIVFMWMPNNTPYHSWFYVQERPDLFLGRTDFFDGQPSRFWAFPPYFGGMRRVLYFDLSDVIEKTPIKIIITDTVIKLFKNALPDVFVNLLGTTDSQMIAADMQRYENYEVRILWLNRTGEQFYPKRIEKAFEDLMPWTNWTITVQTRPMDDELNSLIGNRTVKLSKALNYSFSLANGSRFTVQANRNVIWEVWRDSGEYDPISRYLFEHVEDYFNLTNIEDKSIIPVVLLQLRNDTAIGGTAGIGPGISWFPYNIIIVGYQGGTVTAMEESGPILLTHQLRHEIGHWVSLPHHSAHVELGYVKILGAMRTLTNHFCAFCKDARARMSLLSYYQAIIELFSNSSDVLNRYGNVEALNSIINRLGNALQLFYDWEYTESVRTAIQAYHQMENAINEAQHQDFMYTRVIPTAITLLAVAFVSIAILRRIKKQKK